MKISRVANNLVEFTVEEAQKAKELSPLWELLVSESADSSRLAPTSCRIAVAKIAVATAPDMSLGIEYFVQDGCDVNQVAPHGVTPLMVVAGRGNQKDTVDLIKAGALLEAQDERGATPLIYAFEQLQLPTIAVLVKAGADLSPSIKNEALANQWEEFKNHPHNKDWFQRLQSAQPKSIAKKEIPVCAIKEAKSNTHQQGN